MRGSALAAALSIGTLLAACGDDDPRDAVDEYLAALADGDGKAACARLTSEARQQVAGMVPAASCEAALAAVADRLPAPQRSALHAAQLEVVDESASEATVRVEDASQVRLTKSDDRWLITDVGALDSARGPLGDLFSGGGAGDENSVVQAWQERIDAAEQKLASDPDDEAALAELVRGHYQLATSTADPTTGQFAEDSRGELEATTDAWQRYLGAVEKPEAGLANTAIQAYSGLAQLEEDPRNQRPYWEGASEAAETLTLDTKNPAPYVQLVQYATLAGQTRKADLAGERAIQLAPSGRRKEVETAVEQAKQAAGP